MHCHAINSYHDPTPIFDIIVNAQRYYEHHSYPTRVKACAAVTTEQILQLAGVHAFTAPADQLRELASMEESAVKVAQRSRFRDELAIGHTNENANETANGATNGATNGAVDGTTNGDAHRDSNRTTNGNTNEMMEKLSFIDDESKFRLAFSRADEGKAQLKTAQVRFSSFSLSPYDSCFGRLYNQLIRHLTRLSTSSASSKSRQRR